MKRPTSLMPKRRQQAEMQRQFQHHQGVLSDLCGPMGHPGIGHNGGPPIETWDDPPARAQLADAYHAANPLCDWDVERRSDGTSTWSAIPRDTRPKRCVAGL